MNTRLLHPALATALLAAAPLAAAAQDAPAPNPAPSVTAPEAPAPPAPAAAPDAPAPAPAPAAPAPEAPAAAPETPAPAAPAEAAPAPVAPEEDPGGGAATQPIQVNVGDVQISGDEFAMDPTTGLITVSGNPRAVRGDEEIRATRMIINPRTLQFTAEGDVIIRQGGREFRSTRATYNFEQKSGQAEEVDSLIKQYDLNAQQIVIKPGPVYEARRATFSTCDREHKHYEVYSRVLDVVPGEEMVARDVGIDLLGIRLLTVPTLRKSLRPGDDDSNLKALPTFGYSSYFGPYVRDDFQIRRSNPVWIDASVQLNTLREPNGGLRFGTPGRVQYVGSLFYRDNAPNQRAPNLQVSRLPEVGVVWTSREDVRPGRFLGDRITSVNYPQALDVSTSWIFAAQATAGYFRQHHGERLVEDDGRSKNGGRFTIQGSAVLPLVKLGPVSLNDLRLLARQNVYDNGDTFFTFGAGIGKEIKFGNWRLRADYFQQFTDGATPFLFDDVELRQEFRPSIRFQSRNFDFEYTARINAREGGLFDQTFSISKLFHCIRPTLSYSVRRNEVFLEIRIPGLAGRATNKAGEPRATESTEKERIPAELEPPAEKQP